MMAEMLVIGYGIGWVFTSLAGMWLLARQVAGCDNPVTAGLAAISVGSIWPLIVIVMACGFVVGRVRRGC